MPPMHRGKLCNLESAFCTHGPFTSALTDRRSYNTMVFTTEKISVSGPTQFKGQLYVYTPTHYIYETTWFCAQHSARHAVRSQQMVLLSQSRPCSLTRRYSQTPPSHPTPSSCALGLDFAKWLQNIPTLMFCRWLRLLFKLNCLLPPQYLLFTYSPSQLKPHRPLGVTFWTVSCCDCLPFGSHPSDLFLQFVLVSLFCFSLGSHLLSLELLPECSSFCLIF